MTMTRGARRAMWGAVAIAAVVVAAGPASAGIFDGWGNGSAGYEAALRRHERSGPPVLIYFYADWCPYCRRLDNTILATAVVRQALRGFEKVRINPERGRREAQLARQFGIAGYPSLFIIPSGESTPTAFSPPGAPELFAEACAALRGAPAARAASAAALPARAPSAAAPTEQAAPTEPVGPTSGEVTVVLKDGSRIVGRLVVQDAQAIVVLADGWLRGLKRDAVDRIVEEPVR